MLNITSVVSMVSYNPSIKNYYLQYGINCNISEASISIYTNVCVCMCLKLILMNNQRIRKGSCKSAWWEDPKGNKS